MRDSQTRLQAKGDLTLEELVQMSRQVQARKQSWELIHWGPKGISVDFVKGLPKAP